MFSSHLNRNFVSEALMLEQRGVASSSANSLHVDFDGQVSWCCEPVVFIYLLFIYFYFGDNISLLDSRRWRGRREIGW